MQLELPFQSVVLIQLPPSVELLLQIKCPNRFKFERIVRVEDQVANCHVDADCLVLADLKDLVSELGQDLGHLV